jgi:inward rectifier potassium channel
MIRTEHGAGGSTFYRMLDLKPTRERALSLSRSWSVQHTIDRDSPLHGETPRSLVEKEIELQVLVVGLDDIFMQTVHAQHRYFTDQIVWGARHADVLSETPDGHLMLDLTKFHHVEQTPPTREFPYPETSSAAKAE